MSDQYQTDDPPQGCWRYQGSYAPNPYAWPWYAYGSQYREGWYCPRCHKINAPTLQQCLCGDYSYTYATGINANTAQAYDLVNTERPDEAQG